MDSPIFIYDRVRFAIDEANSPKKVHEIWQGRADDTSTWWVSYNTEVTSEEFNRALAILRGWSDWTPFNIYSPYKLLEAAKFAGLETPFKTFLAEQGLLELFLTAGDLSESNSFLSNVLPMIPAALGITEEQLAQFLAYAKV